MPRKARQFRVLFISADKFPPFRVDVAELFARRMVERGHRIDWILQSQDTLTRSFARDWEGGHVWVGRTDNGASRTARLRKHAYDIVHDCKMFSLLLQNNYEFVQVKDKFVSAFLGILAARLSGIKLIFWLSFPIPEASLYVAQAGLARYPMLYRWRGYVLKVLLYRFIAPMSDHILVQSEQMKKDMMAAGVDERKMTPIPMGVSLGSYPAGCSVPETQSEETGNTIVYLGTLSKVRRIDFLVRVLKRVKAKAPAARLILVGDGEDESDRELISATANTLGVSEAVDITGFLPRADALEHVRRAAVCVSPFFPTPILRSTSPTKLVEYMAMAKAVVANDHPEQRRAIAQSGGGLCVPYEEQAFADAILELLRSPQTAISMGKKGRAYVEAYRDYAKIAKDVENVWLSVLNGTVE